MNAGNHRALLYVFFRQRENYSINVFGKQAENCIFSKISSRFRDPGIRRIEMLKKRVRKTELFIRRRPDLNRRILVLQTIALPLGYGALSDPDGN